MLKQLTTLACKTCGELWSDAAQGCLVDDSKRHQFIELTDHLGLGVKDTMACKHCAQERGVNVHCSIAANQQHAFVVVQVEY